MTEFNIKCNDIVSVVRKQFKEQLGSSIKIYNKNRVAEDAQTLGELGLNQDCNINIEGLTVGDFITKLTNFGIKAKVYTQDEFVAVLDNILLTDSGRIKKGATRADMEAILQTSSASQSDNAQTNSKPASNDEEKTPQYYNELFQSKEPEESEKYFLELIKQGNLHAKYVLAYHYAFGNFRKYSAGYRMLQELVDQNYLPAAYNLSEVYFQTWSKPQGIDCQIAGVLYAFVYAQYEKTATIFALGAFEWVETPGKKRFIQYCNELTEKINCIPKLMEAFYDLKKTYKDQDDLGLWVSEKGLPWPESDFSGNKLKKLINAYYNEKSQNANSKAPIIEDEDAIEMLANFQAMQEDLKNAKSKNTELIGKYNELLEKYNEVSAKSEERRNNYNKLVDEYNELIKSVKSQSSSYIEKEDYNNLVDKYNNLLNEYRSLQAMAAGAAAAAAQSKSSGDDIVDVKILYKYKWPNDTWERSDDKTIEMTRSEYKSLLNGSMKARQAYVKNKFLWSDQVATSVTIELVD